MPSGTRAVSSMFDVDAIESILGDRVLSWVRPFGSRLASGSP